MKTKLLIPFLAAVCFACGNNGRTLTDSQKEKVNSEVKPIVSELIKGLEEANLDLVIGSLDSMDFTYIYGGKVYSYKEFTEGYKPVFATLSNQKLTVASEKYAVLDKSTVLYTLVARWDMNFKDGHSVVQEPWANQFLYKRINGKWKLVSCIESGYERIDKASREPKELNQAELANQFLGKWKSEFNDTTLVLDQKTYGKTGQEVNLKYATKGKQVFEGRQMWAYDRKLDRVIISSVTKDADIWLASLRFDSKSKYSFVFGGDMYHPESAIFRGEGEIVSPDKYVEKLYDGDKLVTTYTYTKVK